MPILGDYIEYRCNPTLRYKTPKIGANKYGRNNPTIFVILVIRVLTLIKIPLIIALYNKAKGNERKNEHKS